MRSILRIVMYIFHLRNNLSLLSEFTACAEIVKTRNRLISRVPHGTLSVPRYSRLGYPLSFRSRCRRPDARTSQERPTVFFWTSFQRLTCHRAMQATLLIKWAEGNAFRGIILPLQLMTSCFMNSSFPVHTSLIWYARGVSRRTVSTYNPLHSLWGIYASYILLNDNGKSVNRVIGSVIRAEMGNLNKVWKPKCVDMKVKENKGIRVRQSVIQWSVFHGLNEHH